MKATIDKIIRDSGFSKFTIWIEIENKEELYQMLGLEGGKVLVERRGPCFVIELVHNKTTTDPLCKSE